MRMRDYYFILDTSSTVKFQKPIFKTRFRGLAMVLYRLGFNRGWDCYRPSSDWIG